MPEIVITAARQAELADGRRRTKSVVLADGVRKTVYVDTSADVPFVTQAVGDIFVAQALVMAMVRGQDLVMEDPISADRLSNLEVAQDILTSWYPHALRRAKLTAPTVEVTPEPRTPTPRRGLLRRTATPPPPPRGTVACFTGGVDSFHTLLKNESRIDSLVYGVGLDVPLAQTEQIARVVELLDRVGGALGKPVHLVSTNARGALGRGVNWGAFSHGAALAGLSTAVSPLARRVLVPGTHSYAAHVPWGSHPLLDTRWSTDRLEIEHDGAEATRSEKMRLIADSPLVLQNLRVCYRQFADLNCGRCTKCLRTMMALHLLDRLDDCTTFARPLDMALFSRVSTKRTNVGTQVQIDDLAQLADSVGGHDEARRAIALLSERHQAVLAAQGSGRSPVPGP